MNGLINQSPPFASGGQKGNTIIEAVLAVLIISIALVGLLSRSGSNLLFSRDSNSRSIASNLAREGVEAVRNIRDTNWLVGCQDPTSDDLDICRHSHDGILSPTNFNTTDKYNTFLVEFPVVGEVALDFLTSSYSFETCQTDNLCRLYLNSDGIYTHSSTGNEATVFLRLNKVYPLCDLEGTLCLTANDPTMVGVKVVSQVKWPFKSDYHEVVLEEYLYDWR